MTTQPLTLQVPEPVFHQLAQRAAVSHRSVEEETLDLLAAAVPNGAALPDELEHALESLKVLDESALWAIVRGRLPEDVSANLEELHRRRDLQGLNDTEADSLAGLIRLYERHMLVRAQALALRKQRGLDVSEFTQP